MSYCSLKLQSLFNCFPFICFHAQLICFVHYVIYFMSLAFINVCACAYAAMKNECSATKKPRSRSFNDSEELSTGQNLTVNH
uniref:Uncharacterized protein n=1 Tax=Rhizophora mucronata TaxID=61149 RepID=A0A2P2QGD8_RHIMU